MNSSEKEDREIAGDTGGAPVSPDGKQPGFVEESRVHAAYLEEVSRRRRPGLLHWAAFVLSLVSLGIIVFWVADSRSHVTAFWAYLDLGLSAAFAVEFFTRSGLRWNWLGYISSRFFDFIAIAPALTLVYFNVPYEGVWVWIVLAARAVRAIDRLLGDGFVRRTFFALLEGLEEEITDRVLIRFISRIEAELYRGSFARGLAGVLERNKDSILNRVAETHPKEGLVANLADLTGLDDALKRAEERTYAAIIRLVGSPEVDRAIREAVDSAFIVMKKEMAEKTWRKRITIRH